MTITIGYESLGTGCEPLGMNHWVWTIGYEPLDMNHWVLGMTIIIACHH